MSVRFIAEVSSNHHQDLERCLSFVDRAAALGCAAVKFQLFKIADLFSPEILARSAEHRRRGQWELPPRFLPALADRCRAASIELGCTPFYLEAVQELSPHVDFFKISSYELTWPALLEACAETGKPLVLSTGMATRDEVARAVATIEGAGAPPLTLLHCTSCYPAPAPQCNLSAIETLRARFDRPTGWSDHSTDPAVIYRAVHRFGASAVEFHLDLEGDGVEFAGGHCWLPEQIEPVIAAVRRGVAADGDGEIEPADCELPDRDWRADPEDGLRPARKIREGFAGDEAAGEPR